MADKLSRGAVRDDETGVSELYRLRSENNQLQARVAEVCGERDAWHDWADTLAYKVAPVEVLGRHGEKGKFPWHDALELITPAAEVAALRVRVAELEAERHTTNEALSDAAEQLRVQRDRIAELETERRKYVGVEPTVAEEMAYMNRCLNAVYAVCDAAEKQATRWEQPLPVPEWVALVRNAADGLTLAAPALPPAPIPRQAEDPHDSPLHHDYALGRDLPTPHPTDAGSAL